MDAECIRIYYEQGIRVPQTMMRMVFWGIFYVIAVCMDPLVTML